MEKFSENKNPLFYKGLIFCFSALYLLVAFISFWHCIAFCLVGNPMWISVMMSFAFEVGLAATLFSILTTDNKNTFVAWILMTFLTFVQVIGNVYSVFKYMVESHTDFYKYIQDSMLHWFVEDVSTNDIMSIIAIILGALLPIVALLMTSMVSNNLKRWLNMDNNSDSVPSSPSVNIPDNEYSNEPEYPFVNISNNEEEKENVENIEEKENTLEKDNSTERKIDYSSETNDYEQTEYESPDSYDLGISQEEPEEEHKSLAEVVQEQPVSSIFENNDTINRDENGQPDEENEESLKDEEEEIEESSTSEDDKESKESNGKKFIGPGMRITSSMITSDLNNLPKKKDGESIIGKEDLPVKDNPNIVFDPNTGKYVNNDNIDETSETNPIEGLNPYNIDTKPLEEEIKNNIGSIVKKGPFTVFNAKVQ